MKTAVAVLHISVALALGGCAAFPSSGPTADVIDPGFDKRDALIDYELFDIDPVVIGALNRFKPTGLSASFGYTSKAPLQMIGVGDQVVVTLFEAGAGGLFSGPAVPGAPSTKTLTLPMQTVDRDGAISVPFAGRIKAVGRTPDEVSQSIVAALKDKSIEPQAIVSISQSSAVAATVVGDATGAAQVPLNIKGDRILEVVAQGGGIKTLPHETFIRLTRGNKVAEASLRTILNNPSENVFVRPGDTIYVTRKTPKFTVLGAVNLQKDYLIDQDNLTLADAVARSNGLIDAQADSSAVFLFRYEKPAVVRAINPTSKFLNGVAEIPVIYRLSFRRPSDYFYAQKMLVQNNDLLYIADAPTVELTKFVTLVKAIVSVGAIASGSSSIAN